ncbi:nuclear transport factor 2 family protein [Streptomyces sp. NBC_01216]|uniref:nuclear transport factor 2 family protein n=1 Tax=Streptomyces sp. NBC_01216 TaxID=2903778 RepID=UPI002E0D7A5A|nr:nuclear transport factor 2 family protein [Streptomyces sp. NBC_01216]
MTEHTPAVAAAVEGELRLLDPTVRASAELFGALLHPEFEEFGSSGRRWDRASIIAAMTEGATPRPITASRMRGVQLAPDVVHLTFVTDSHGVCAHRSSIWRLTEGRWLLYFHQGTPFGPAECATD